MKVRIIYHLEWYLGKETSNCSNRKTCWTQFWNNHTYVGLPSGVLSSVIPRNLVLQILAIFLLSWVIYKSIKDLFLVTNCIKCFLSIFSVNKFVLNQLFIPWMILITPFLKFVWSGLVMIILVLSANRTVLELSFEILSRLLM